MLRVPLVFNIFKNPGPVGAAAKDLRVCWNLFGFRVRGVRVLLGERGKGYQWEGYNCEKIFIQTILTHSGNKKLADVGTSASYGGIL